MTNAATWSDRRFCCADGTIHNWACTSLCCSGSMFSVMQLYSCFSCCWSMRVRSICVKWNSVDLTCSMFEAYTCQTKTHPHDERSLWRQDKTLCARLGGHNYICLLQSNKIYRETNIYKKKAVKTSELETVSCSDTWFELHLGAQD